MRTLQDLVSSLEHKPGVAKSWKDEQGSLVSVSFSDYYETISSLSQGFLQLGVKRGDHVAYVADNHPEWVAVSLALNNIGAVDVPRGTDSPMDELSYVMDHSDASFLIVKNRSLHEKLAPSIPRAVKEVISLDDSVGIPLSQLKESGKRSSWELPLVDEEDLSGIIYTSGTTGRPKGVMLTHKNFLSNFPVLAAVEGMDEHDRWMSVLPPWHVFQRAAEYCALHTGAEMYHTEVAKIGKELSEVKPTILPTVPRVWESIYAKALKELENAAKHERGLKKIILQAAVPRIIPNLIVPGELRRAMKEKLGGHMRFAVSGGGALPAHIDDFFRKAGVEIIEGYGMTETSPVIAARLRGEGKKARYTVGYPLPNVNVRIADPDTNQPLLPRTYGEVQVNGPTVMKGYYKDESSTKNALIKDDEGGVWLKTGDRGRFDRHGHLRLSGRYKETIIGTNGENIDPVSLEAQLKKHPLVENAMVFKPEHVNLLFAIFTPNRDTLKEYCQEQGIAYDESDVLNNPRIQEAYNDILKSYNQSAKPQHKIGGIKVLDEAFKIGSEITTTLKLKRKEILENRSQAVKDLVYRKK